MLVSRLRIFIAAPLLVLVLGLAPAACQLAGDASNEQEVQAAIRMAPPVPDAQLDSIYTANRGLLRGLAADGAPLTSGPDMDPMIVEARRFYDTVQAPFAQPAAVDYPDPFTGASTPTRVTAPLTLDAWKQTFGFSARQAGEDLQAYRDRAGIATYYNRNELGLGRELGCARFVDGHDGAGRPIWGVACFVTNHGPGFRAAEASLRAAIEDREVRNTVCISYRPTADPGYGVQFYVYGADGKRQDWARLDTAGPRPHPHVCMNCHGGAYDGARHLAKNAHFLPLDPNLVVFADGAGLAPGVTRAGQEERIRAFNAMALETPLTPAQTTMLAKVYGGSVAVAGGAATGDGVPDAWAGSDYDRDFYRGVIRPYCATCHLAGQRLLADADLPTYTMFATPAAFATAPLEAFVCARFSMPNAQPTSLAFWDAANNSGVTVAGATFPTAADALLARRGFDRLSCIAFADVSGCSRGLDPDALCGGGVSGGAVCDRASGRCVPVLTSGP